MKIKKLSNDLRVKYSIADDGTLGTKVILIFQRRLWFIFWESFYPHHYYCIHVKDFWDMGGPFADETLLNSGTCGERYETWKPWRFNLEKRINNIHKEIISEQHEANQVFKQVHG